MSKYLDFFGAYKKIEFKNEKLDSIINKFNFMDIKLTHYSKDVNEANSLIINILNDNIEAYEFDLKEVDKPEGKNEENIYCSLMNISKGVSGWRTWIYWRAYKFFRERDLYIRPISGVSNYLTLDCTEKLNYLNPEYNSVGAVSEEAMDIITNYKTIIRCGEIEDNRILSELTRGDFLWIFPYTENENSSKCYVLKSKEEFKSIRDKYISDEFNKVKHCFNFIK